MAFLEDQQLLAACGSWRRANTSCYQLSPGNPPSWQPMPPLGGQHCSWQASTRSKYLEGLGWLLLGQDEQCLDGAMNIMTELYTTDHEWIDLPVASPYADGYPDSSCVVAVNSTTLFVCGGYNGHYQSSSWMLDLTDYSWIQLQDMPESRYGHACALTMDNNEILIAGGVYNGGDKSTVYIFNISNNSWRQIGDLPSGFNYNGYIEILQWNNQHILLEYGTTNIWLSTNNGLSWERMEASMGAKNYGDVAVVVPMGLYQCP